VSAKEAAAMTAQVLAIEDDAPYQAFSAGMSLAGGSAVLTVWTHSYVLE
jgi:hypothetical protein